MAKVTELKEVARALEVPSEGPKCALYIAERKICMSEKSLARIKRALGIGGLTDDKRALARIQELMSADDEISLLQNPRIKQILGNDADKELAQRFRPPGPATSRDLLSNFHIDSVMYHFALAYRGFMPISFAMIDFTAYDSHLREFSVEKMLKLGFTHTGCVVNTDMHNGRGKHWICVFVDCRPSTWTVESFNSSGKPIRPEIASWMDAVDEQLIVAQSKAMGASAASAAPAASAASMPHTEKIQVYGVQHQRGDTECGLYALYYIWSRINGADPHLFFKRIISDDEIAKFRAFLFRDDD